MTKYHLKRKIAPKTWPVLRKERTFIVRPRPSGHSLSMTLPITVVLRDVLKLVQTAKQAQQVLRSHEVMVNNKRVHHKDDAVCFMDILSIGKDRYRVLINKNNTLTVTPVKKGEEVTLQRIKNKTTVAGGKTQVNFESGANLLADKDAYKVGDTLAVALDGKITDHLPLKEGVAVFITGGTHIAVQGTIEKIDGRVITIKTKNGSLLTAKKYTYVIGKDKPSITI